MVLPKKIRTELTQLLGSQRFITRGDALDRYAHDETPGMSAHIPDAVAIADNARQVATIMRLCYDNDIPVTPRGAGTGHAGGCVAVAGGLVLDLSNLRHRLNVSAADLSADVDAGVVLQDVHNAVEEVGLFYPPDPGSLDTCTIAGTVATNAGGPRALSYGVTRDYVLGLDVVLANGEPLRLGKRTVKGVSGYDLCSLIVGSEGTLAVITGVTLKLLPQVRAVQTALVCFGSASQAAVAITKLLTSGVRPRVLEYMDGRCVDALRTESALTWPQACEAALIVEVENDDDDACLTQLARAMEVLDRHGAASHKIAQGERQRREIWKARRSLTDVTRHILGSKVAEDIAVPRSRMPEAVARIADMGLRLGLQTAVYGHAGDGNLHVQVLYAHQDQRPLVEQCLDSIMALAIELGGTLSGEHGIGYAKKRFMHLEHSAGALELMRQLKRSFDPKGLLNPGKIF